MGSRDEAEDTLHDVFLKVFDKIGGLHYRSEAELSAWLRRLCVNHCIDSLRRRKLKIVPLTEREDVPDEKEIVVEEVKGIPPEALLKFVSELPPGYRTVFNLYAVEDMSHKEIGKLLGIAERSSSSQYARAQGACRFSFETGASGG